MHLLPSTLQFSLLASSFALIMAGFALAGAAFTRDPELVAASAAIFLFVAVGIPLLISRQIRQAFRSSEASDDPSFFDERIPDESRDFDAPSLSEETDPSTDEEALRRMQKAQAVERLRDGITHDLNNRLMVISANIDSVARHVKDQPVLQRKLLSALVASDQAAKLIANSTAFARQGEAQVQYVDLAERVESIATLMGRSMLRDTVELRVALSPDLWSVRADPDDLATAIVTLSAQLRDALVQGGTVTLEAQNVHVRRGMLPNLSVAGDFVQLAIRSNAPADRMQPPEGLAEQAFTIRDLDLSSWFVLSQSLHFLQAIGGASEVRRNGPETAILLYLPRAQDATLLPAGMAEEDEMPSGEVRDHTEILVVDDEVEVALALQSTLEEFGYVASIATDAGEAIKSLSARKPGLLLTDVTLPGPMNGVMLAREVRQMHPDLPVLLITGNPLVADEGSEFPLLQKPIISRDLHAVIQRHLQPQAEDKVVPLFPRASQRAG